MRLRRGNRITRWGVSLAIASALASFVHAQAPAPPAQEPGPAPAGARGAAPGGGPGRGGPGRGAALPPLTPQAIERAQAILAETRKALGDKFATTTSIIANGQTRRVRGDNLVPIEFEINIELPDKYVRKDEVPAEESQPTTNGFVGSEVIAIAAAPPAGRGGRIGGPGQPPPGSVAGRGAPAAPPTPEQLEAQRTARLIAAKQEFARLVIGMFAVSPETYPLTFGYAAQAAAPQGTADVLDVRGAGNFAARLFIDSTTRLPIMLSWQAPAPGQPTPVETRLYYADYREVNGAKLPFRLRRAVGADTTEETAFDRFRLNTKIDPKRFTVPK